VRDQWELGRVAISNGMNQIVRREIERDASTMVNLRLDSGMQAMRSMHGTKKIIKAEG
jgi:hypothetical protein